MATEPSSTPLFKTKWFPELVAKIFAKRPHEKIWAWAERNVFLATTMAPEPTFYDSRKTPWTRRIQELCQHPYHRGRRIKRIVVKKSSQTGFTEAVLNFVRWSASFAPKNVIYAIDSQEEAANISDRLRNTLDSLGEEILTDNEKDITTRKMVLRHMIVWLFGSGASGKFANKQAPAVICDEIEEYKKITGETSAVGNAASRMKKSAEGILIELSKPKLRGGPIDVDHALGNQEIFLCPCPHCGTYQEIAFERLQFKHCKNLLGEWDKERVLADTWLRCASYDARRDLPESEIKNCPPISEAHRYEMAQRGVWFETGVGSSTYDPEVISQQISDLYDCDNPRVWGEIAKAVIAARGNHVARQEVWNHRLGREYALTTARAEVMDVLRCKFAYKRKTIPWPPFALLLGADVGLGYAKGAVVAINGAGDFALVDWFQMLHPGEIAAHVKAARYFCPADGKHYEIWQGVIDQQYRKEEVYSACMLAPGQLWPAMGVGGIRTRQAFAWGAIPTYPSSLKLLSFYDDDFKTELYIDRIKRAVPPGLNEVEAADYLAKLPRFLVPEDTGTDLIEELIHEHYIDGKWIRPNNLPNHYGDCLKLCCVFWRWFKRTLAAPAGETAQEANAPDAGSAPDIRGL